MYFRGLAVTVWVTAAISTAGGADHYRLDAGNTRVAFAVNRLGHHWVQTRFGDVTGRLIIDPRGADSTVDVNVAAASLASDDLRMNERLRSADWLDVRQFPQLSYHSRQIQYDGHGGALVLGQLTLHGVTREVAMQVQSLSCPSDGQLHCGFTARGTIRRSQFGLTRALWLTGDEVILMIDSSELRADPHAG